eukprot:tig00000944_g5925.t1
MFASQQTLRGLATRPPTHGTDTNQAPPPTTAAASPPGGFAASEGRVESRDVVDEISTSYLEYAMSVIVGRALPDVRDGLKPVHRRVLYAMYELNLSPDTPFRKCARVVGEVLGKYHPHGDTSVYDALVRMAQEFSMREPLVDGHGNFGSVDGDPPAAMRYTECRLRKLAQETLLKEINMDTVEWTDNFDGSRKEPAVLPSRLPQLLLNGSSGIAVGMATNIPPHNLGELCDAMVALIRDPSLTDLQLMEFIRGPDFPTGGTIIGTEGTKSAYTTGHGSIVVRGRSRFEEVEAGRGQPRTAIIITELPYQTNKASFIEHVADMVNDKKLVGVSDIRDESDRDGMRVVIELKRDANPQVVLNNLVAQSGLQTRFGANMLALDAEKKPRPMRLSEFLHQWLAFRVETVERKTRFELRAAEERFHILEGFLIMLRNVDAVVEAVRAAPDAPAARASLVSRFALSEAQATAVLALQLRRLTGMESSQVAEEHGALRVKVGELRGVLASRERVLGIIEEELRAIKAAFATPRRTEVLDDGRAGRVDEADLIENNFSCVIVTAKGYIKRMEADTFRSQRRGTRGARGAAISGDDVVEHFFMCNDRDAVLFFSDTGIAYSAPAYQIPASARAARGVALMNVVPVSREERITSVLPVCTFSEEEQLLFVTSAGQIKRTSLSAFAKIRSSGLTAISLGAGDHLVRVARVRPGDFALIATRSGKCIRIAVTDEEVRVMGRAAGGVRAIRLRDGDEVISMDIIPRETEGQDPAFLERSGPWVFTVTSKGVGKRLPISEFRTQARGGSGVIATSLKTGASVADNGLEEVEEEGEEEEEVAGRRGGARGGAAGAKLVSMRVVLPDDEALLVTARGTVVRLSMREVPLLQTRGTKGVRLQRLDAGDELVACAIVVPEGSRGRASNPGGPASPSPSPSPSPLDD